jgi:hypothetical protein
MYHPPWFVIKIGTENGIPTVEMMGNCWAIRKSVLNQRKRKLLRFAPPCRWSSLVAIVRMVRNSGYVERKGSEMCGRNFLQSPNGWYCLGSLTIDVMTVLKSVLSSGHEIETGQGLAGLFFWTHWYIFDFLLNWLMKNEIIQRRVVGYMNDELEAIWEEVVLAQYVDWRYWEKPRWTSTRRPTEIRTEER